MKKEIKTYPIMDLELLDSVDGLRASAHNSFVVYVTKAFIDFKLPEMIEVGLPESEAEIIKEYINSSDLELFELGRFFYKKAAEKYPLPHKLPDNLISDIN